MVGHICHLRLSSRLRKVDFYYIFGYSHLAQLNNSRLVTAIDKMITTAAKKENISLVVSVGLRFIHFTHNCKVSSLHRFC